MRGARRAVAGAMAALRGFPLRTARCHATTGAGMTVTAATPPVQATASPGAAPPDGWRALRADEAIQFAPVEIPPTPPPQPSWLERMLAEVFEFLGTVFGPVGRALGGAWVWLQWVVLGVVVLFALLLVVRLYAPGLLQRVKSGAAKPDTPDEWRPDMAESQALLEDADSLAAAGRFDEATHLLLQRSVIQIATARPDWVEPSSTARELAALPALPDAARAAFRAIAERVERSLFALRRLDRADWEAARAAYAEFALARLDQAGRPA